MIDTGEIPVIAGNGRARAPELGSLAHFLGHAHPSLTQDVYMGRKVVTADAARLLDRQLS